LEKFKTLEATSVAANAILRIITRATKSQ